MIRVCFVCLGNICRSPTAEAVFRHMVEANHLGDRVAVESAGTAAYHLGEQADPRARAAGKQRGYQLNGRARQFVQKDFERFDYVLAMDQDNRRALSKLAPNDEARAKVSLLRSFDATAESGAEVPDPYYGGPGGFDLVIDICERACQGLLKRISKEAGAR